jgi:maltose alpha-D-glucosyltransferase/alpha-amylase
MPRHDDSLILADNPQWYKDAIIYELHVRAFRDSDGDGIGDFRGLTDKLDYLQDLGVTALWLLPFCPSPLRDDGYDIADYSNIHPHYGTLRDFRTFLRQAHRRGLRVITELVVNHTSDQHAWFQRARRAKPGSRWRNFYVWSDTPEQYADTRIIFRDFEPSNWTWDPAANAYYWHRFYAHQPDLNYDHPDVRRAVRRALDFWLDMGVDGLRLDAVPYLYERDGTSCENLPETHAFLQDLRRHVETRYANRMLLAEANQWPEDAVAYFGNGNECHMNFHFPLMPRLFMSLRMEDRYPIIDILEQTPAIPASCQWALFLRNHDELTLEMVTDEERDYMYRAYARDQQMRINLGIRRRLAPLLGNDRRKMELLNGLLFALPGSPVLYYGDEIGMGDNFYLGDRNGVRTPMQWSPDRNAGFSQANPHKLFFPVIIDPEYHYEALNVEMQQRNPHSLLWWMKHLISLRKRFKVFGRGAITFLHPENRKILAFTRHDGEATVLVVANLSRYPQCAELDLASYEGMTPLELQGQQPFPPVAQAPYVLTLNAYAFYWFALVSPAAEATEPADAALPALTARDDWATILHARNQTALEAILPAYLRARRWFAGKARTIRQVHFLEAIPVPRQQPVAYTTLVEVAYTDGEPETYVLPMMFATGEQVAQMAESPAAIARLRVQTNRHTEDGLLYDAMFDRAFATTIFNLIARGQQRASTRANGLVSLTTRNFRSALRLAQSLEPAILQAEQSNTSILYGDQFILKLYRRLEEGINPEFEIGRYLTETQSFPHTAPIAGALAYHQRDRDPMTVAILQRFVANQGDAWSYTLNLIRHYYDTVLTQHHELDPAAVAPHRSLLAFADDDLSPLAEELIGVYLEAAQTLGQRTAELHVALAQAADSPDFAPEPFTDFYRRSLSQRMMGQANQTLKLLRQRWRYLPEALQGDAQLVLDRQDVVRRQFQVLRDRKISAMRIRCHGDYHLGQVLYTGKDFTIIDFEGEPARSLGVRRMKRSPLRDVAGMLRSFHYAAYAALLGQGASVRPEDYPTLAPWAQFWYGWVGGTFLRAYLDMARHGYFLPTEPEHLQILLDAYLLEKALYELTYELNSRPAWVQIPLRGIIQLLETVTSQATSI